MCLLKRGIRCIEKRSAEREAANNAGEMGAAMIGALKRTI